nr:phospholipase-like protein [Tanacetum cinerariifolium]
EYRKWYLQMRDYLEEKINVVLKETGVFEKKNIDPAKYKFSFKVADGVPKQGGVFGDCCVFLCMFLYRLANGISLALDDPLQSALAY